MITQKEDRFFRFSNLSKFPEIIQGISNRNYGDMHFGFIDNKAVLKNRNIFFEEMAIDPNKVIVASLAHDKEIFQVGSNELKKAQNNNQKAEVPADGLMTDKPEIYLMITVADCLPIMIYDPVSRIILLLHAGWRGILAGIISNGISQMKIKGSDPANIIVGIGPAICQKHFIVRKDVLENFLEKYPKATFVRNTNGYVDLKKIAKAELEKVGVSKFNIEIADFCPSCDNGLYGSYRKEGVNAPASAAILGMRF